MAQIILNALIVAGYCRQGVGLSAVIFTGEATFSLTADIAVVLGQIWKASHVRVGREEVSAGQRTQTSDSIP